MLVLDLFFSDLLYFRYFIGLADTILDTF